MKAKICIIGPGVVGQATGKVFVKLGYKTVFLGGNPEKTKKLRKGGYTAYGRGELFNGSYDFDISMLTVPTPTIDGEINLSAIKSASIDLGKRLKLSKKDYHLVVVKSTVPPGTSKNIVAEMVEFYSGRKLGKGFGLCMNPEYLREKNAYEDGLNPRVILIGQHDKKSGDLLASVYKKFKCPIVRCSVQEAEFQKYIHNLFNAVKITFFNEMRQICQECKFDTKKIFDVTAQSAEGMWNSKYGIRNLGPFSGSCLPKDTKAFLHWVHKNGASAPLLKTVIKINETLIEANGQVKKEVVGADL